MIDNIFTDAVTSLKQSYGESKWRMNNFSRIEDFVFQNKTFENICVIGSPYVLLLYLLYSGDLKNTIFVFQGKYPLKEAADNLRRYGCTCMFISYDENVTNEGHMWNEVIQSIDYKDINIFVQDTMSAFENFSGKPITLIEDGRISYISYSDSQKTKGFKVYSYHPDVKQIIYAGLEPIPDALKNKSIVISIEDLWNKKNKVEKKQLLSIFDFDYDDMIQLINTGRNIIVFTRNYSTIGKCSLQEHLDMYREVISNYNQNQVIIKPHPNDNVNYQAYFPTCCILPTKLPAELLHLCSIPIKTVVSIDASSNVFGSIGGDVKIELYEHLLKKYNVISLRNR